MIGVQGPLCVFRESTEALALLMTEASPLNPAAWTDDFEEISTPRGINSGRNKLAKVAHRNHPQLSTAQSKLSGSKVRDLSRPRRLNCGRKRACGCKKRAELGGLGWLIS